MATETQPTEVLVSKYEGHVVPKTYLTQVKAALKGDVFVSFCALDKGEDKQPKFTIMRNEPLDLDPFMDVQEIFKSNPMVMLFHTYKPPLEEDQQPFELLSDKDDKDVCVGFAVGDYPTYVKKDSSHTPAFHAMVEGVRPKLLETYDICGGDVGDFADEISGKVFTRKIEDIGTNTKIVLMLTSSKVNGYIKDDGTAGKTVWGFTTNMLSPPEAAKEEPQQVGKTMVERLANAMGRPAKTNKDAKAGSAPVTAPAVAPEKVHPPSGTKEEGEWLTCPAHISGNKNRRNWWRNKIGYKPDGCEAKDFKFFFKKQPDPMATSSNKAIEAARAAVGDAAPQTIPKPDEKRTTPDQPIEVPTRPTVPAVEPTRLIPPENLKNLKMAFLKLPTVIKLLDDANEEILDPAVSLENDIPGLMEQLGLDGDITRTKNWSRQILEIMTQMGGPKAIIRGFEEWRSFGLTAAEERDALLEQFGPTTIPKPEKPAVSATPTPPAASASSGTVAAVAHSMGRKRNKAAA